MSSSKFPKFQSLHGINHESRGTAVALPRAVKPALIARKTRKPEQPDQAASIHSHGQENEIKQDYTTVAAAAAATVTAANRNKLVL